MRDVTVELVRTPTRPVYSGVFTVSDCIIDARAVVAFVGVASVRRADTRGLVVAVEFDAAARDVRAETLRLAVAVVAGTAERVWVDVVVRVAVFVRVVVPRVGVVVAFDATARDAARPVVVRGLTCVVATGAGADFASSS